MTARPMIWVALAFVAGILAVNSAFLVDQRRQVIVAKLGAPARVINPWGVDDPGVKFKIPVVESLVTLDKRNQGFEAEGLAVMSADQQPLSIDATLRYRIVDPLAFRRAFGDDETGGDRLQTLIGVVLRQSLGAASEARIISQDREPLVAEALQAVRARTARDRLGIEALDLRLTRVDLAPAGRPAVFERMRASLRGQADAIRAEGDARRREIMADGDHQVSTILAGATEQAYADRGAADAETARIFRDSFGKDPSFAAFYRSMQAYEGSLAGEGTTLVLSADSAFLKYLKKGPTGR